METRGICGELFASTSGMALATVVRTGPRIRVLIALLDDQGQLSRCAIVSEEDLPMPWAYVVIGRDPDDERKASCRPDR
jgi:hypothetical protein